VYKNQTKKSDFVRIDADTHGVTFGGTRIRKNKGGEQPMGQDSSGKGVVGRNGETLLRVNKKSSRGSSKTTTRRKGKLYTQR